MNSVIVAGILISISLAYLYGLWTQRREGQLVVTIGILWLAAMASSDRRPQEQSRLTEQERAAFRTVENIYLANQGR
jgi:hypothetical protein